MKLFSKVFATFFGAGYFPLAPGTLTSAIVILLYKYLLHKLSWPVYLSLFFLLFFLGIWVSDVHSKTLKKEDPRSVVIDEAVGQFLVLFLLSPQWILCLVSFFLFRFFDIFKPFPIKKVETFPGGFGIMLDDILAALYAGILINLYLLLR
jgi:phosphatidylglycerophosphatase A